MAQNRSLYTILGLDDTATDMDIQAAYNRLIVENPEGSPRYNQIVQAYTILSDLDSRAKYDITGKIKEPAKVKRHYRSNNNREKIRYTLNTLFLAGAAATTILFVLQWSGAISTTPFYWSCGTAMLIKIAEYIIRLLP